MTERSKKVYVAAGFEDKVMAKSWMEELENRGFEITTDWTQHKPLFPYSNNSELSGQYAKEDLDGVSECDIFILNPENAGTGAHCELGAAIVLNKKIFIVGKPNENKMFYFHPRVRRVETFEKLLDEIGGSD